ncbi:COP9 signalosome complex subunit 6 [Clydaea vesicula]|uniref:COP9 signalosome complex subunit 6 n=1 Tax=Clydaea vesicula TaxID=447962 RepID=A0AAD5TWJ3_9FUNG|nr:COP9 signalosome complex subunit 6 [Clydaea vesicula]
MGDSMKIDEDNFVVDMNLTTSSLHSTLHPLAIMNISDHYKRFSAQCGQSTVYGALLGTQNGHQIEIFNTFELKFDNQILDLIFFQQRFEQYKQVFPNYEFLGWYVTDQKPLKSHIEIHKQFLTFNENPLFLLLNPYQKSAKDLPIYLFESQLNNATHLLNFTSISFKIKTNEEERIAVEHVTHSSSSDEKEKVLTDFLLSQKNAVNMLSTRIKFLINYIKEIQKSNLPMDNEILRDVASLCHRLPTIDDADFRKELLTVIEFY